MNSKSLIFFLRTAAMALLTLLAYSCQWMTEDYDGCEDDIDNATRYINLTISVSSEQTAVTRAPQGGENGDGREAAFERENNVSGITLILYKGNGLDDATAKVDFVRYFTVSLVRRDSQGTTYNYDATTGRWEDEAVYTTGDQALEEDALDFGATYHVLIIANSDLSATFPKGTPISTVRDYPIQNICTTLDREHPYNSQGFLMTSERDATISFPHTPLLPKEDNNYGLVYHVWEPLLIERMSARIDYCTKGGVYDATLGGYKYEVDGTEDIFVVTKVIPFNLYDGTEYLCKRVQNNWTDATPIVSFLGNESTTNFVVDPNTASKTNTTPPSYYVSPIAQDMSGSGYYPQVMSSCQPPTGGSSVSSNGQTFTDADGENNVIIAYAKENTLLPTSQLKTYATGIAFECKYYQGGTSGTPVTQTYYYYLRHQGEMATGSYMARQWADIDDTETCTVPMNFGVVRNNIYRISVNRVSPDAGKLELHIAVHDWRNVKHPEIYI